MRRALALALTALLGGCAGLPVAHGYLFVGVGYVRVDRRAQAVGIRSASLGVTAGCQSLIIGAQRSYCVRLPLGEVAIIDGHAPRPAQHLAVLSTKEFENEVLATAHDR